MLKLAATAFSLVSPLAEQDGPVSAQPPQQAMKAEKTAAIDRIVQAEMAARKIPRLQLAIVHRQQIIFSAAYGYSNIKRAIPVVQKTMFPINSISKAFAGVAAMQLVEAGNSISMLRHRYTSKAFRCAGAASPSGNC